VAHHSKTHTGPAEEGLHQRGPEELGLLAIAYVFLYKEKITIMIIVILTALRIL
jgi:hypothetical protein